MITAELRVLINDFQANSTAEVALEWLGTAEYTVTSRESELLLQLQVHGYAMQVAISYHQIEQSRINILEYTFEEMVRAMKKETHEIYYTSK